MKTSLDLVLSLNSDAGSVPVSKSPEPDLVGTEEPPSSVDNHESSRSPKRPCDENDILPNPKKKVTKQQSVISWARIAGLLSIHA